MTPPRTRRIDIHETVTINKWLVRALVVALAIGFVVLAYVTVQGQANTQDNRKLINEQKMDRLNAHNDQVTENASLQKQIADALCAATDGIQKGRNPNIDKLRVKYRCVGAASALKPAPATEAPKATLTPSVTVTASSTSTATATRTATAHSTATIHSTATRTLQVTHFSTATAIRTILKTETVAPSGILKSPICVVGVVCVP